MNDYQEPHSSLYRPGCRNLALVAARQYGAELPGTYAIVANLLLAVGPAWN